MYQVVSVVAFDVDRVFVCWSLGLIPCTGQLVQLLFVGLVNVLTTTPIVTTAVALRIADAFHLVVLSLLLRLPLRQRCDHSQALSWSSLWVRTRLLIQTFTGNILAIQRPPTMQQAKVTTERICLCTTLTKFVLFLLTVMS